MKMMAISISQEIRNRFRMTTLCVAACFALHSGCLASDSPSGKSERWSGYLIDMSCALERRQSQPDLGKKHTKRCLQMPSCERSGLGLLLENNQVLHFDDQGNQITRKLISRTSRENDLRVVVYGRKMNDVLQVEIIRFEATRK